MKTEDIKKMGRAYLQVLEGKKKLDPVDQDELKGDHEDRDDKDIDNDGDADKSDEYLHNRRKTISKKMQKDTEVVEGVQKLSNARLKYHATKNFPHGSYSKKEIDAEHKRRMKTEPNYHTVKPSMNEDNEQIDEISKKTLSSYVKKASTDMYDKGGRSVYHSTKAAKASGPFADQTKKKHRQKSDEAERKAANRATGIERAMNRMTKEQTSWPIYDRIMEKRDEHTKGATKPQEMDDNWSDNAKKFVDMHGGLTGNETNIDGAKAAAQTAANIKNSGKVAPKRPADQTIGDKTPPK